MPPPIPIVVILTSISVQILVILTSTTSPILVIDFFSQPNSGHIDVFWTTTITRISASKADLKLKKASGECFTPFSLLRGSRSMIYQFFSDYGRVPLSTPMKPKTRQVDIFVELIPERASSLAKVRKFLIYKIWILGGFMCFVDSGRTLPPFHAWVAGFHFQLLSMEKSPPL